MKVKIVGAEQRTGDFTPKDKPDTSIHYDNLVLHCIGHELKVKGCTAVQLSMKMADAAELIAEVGGTIDKFVGHEYDIDTKYRTKISNAELLK